MPRRTLPPAPPRGRARWPYAIAALALALIVAGVGWTRFQPRRSSAPPVVLISIDTLRADHLPIYGSKSVRTPTIDALAVAGAFILAAALVALWISSDPALVATLGSEAQLSSYANDEFVAYYSDNPAAVFAGTVWTNNAWIAAPK